MDRRKFNRGTPGNKGGRPPKADEQELIERLGPLEEEAYQALRNGLEAGKPWAVKLFFEFRYGKPRQQTSISINHQEEQPIFHIIREVVSSPEDRGEPKYNN